MYLIQISLNYITQQHNECILTSWIEKTRKRTVKSDTNFHIVVLALSFDICNRSSNRRVHHIVLEWKQQRVQSVANQEPSEEIELKLTKQIPINN